MKKNKGIAPVLIIVIVLLIIVIGGTAYLVNKNSNSQNKVNDNLISSENKEIKEDNVKNDTVPIDSAVPVVSQTRNQVKDCGSISYKDFVFTMFGDETTPKPSSKSISSIKCANDSLLSCTPAKLIIEATSDNPVFPDQKMSPPFPGLTYNITNSSKIDNCVVSECVVPIQVIKDRNTTEKENLIFTLVGIGPGAPGMTSNDVYDPVTKLVTKNVCPNTNNPYQMK